MKHLSLLSLTLLFSGPAWAQNSFSAQPDSAATAAEPPRRNNRDAAGFAFQRYTWDASIDASFVLPSFFQISNNYPYGGYQPGFNIGTGYATGYGYGYSSGTFTNSRSTRFLLRKNETVLSKTNIPKRKGAYRFSANISGGYANASNDSILFNNPATSTYYFVNNTRSYALRGAVGYEWQQQLSRFQLYYGYDVFAGFGHSSNQGEERDATGSRQAVKYSSNFLNIGVAPLAGVKFFVHPRFSLGLEATYFITYSRSRNETNSKQFAYITRNVTQAGLDFGLIPLSAFNATFHFGRVVQR